MSGAVLVVAFLVVAFLFGVSSLSTFAQERSSHFDEPAEVLLPHNYSPDRAHPVLVFPQATYTTARTQALRFGINPETHHDFVLVLPRGTFTRDDYLPDFIQFVEWYEERLLDDLETVKDTVSVDPDRVYLAGFSLGGDLSWALSSRNPNLFAGAVMSGTRASYPMSTEARQVLEQRGYRAAFLIGEDEAPARAQGIRHAYEHLSQARIETQFEEHPGAHQAPDRLTGREALDFVTEGQAMIGEPGRLSGTSSTSDATELHLKTDFRPDPHTISVEGVGGSTRLPGASCTGYIEDTDPDATLFFEAGTYPLSFVVEAGATLYIQPPGGTSICEAHIQGHDSTSITFRFPDSGTYDVWVAAPEAGSRNRIDRVELTFTEFELDAPTRVVE